MSEQFAFDFGAEKKNFQMKQLHEKYRELFGVMPPEGMTIEDEERLIAEEEERCRRRLAERDESDTNNADTVPKWNKPR